jgi:hypothetical protein
MHDSKGCKGGSCGSGGVLGGDELAHKEEEKEDEKYGDEEEEEGIRTHYNAYHTSAPPLLQKVVVWSRAHAQTHARARARARWVSIR